MKYCILNIYSQSINYIYHGKEIPFFHDYENTAKKRLSYQVRRNLALNIVRYLLPDVPDVEINHAPSGRPFLVCGNPHMLLPHVSISHSGPWIGCVLSEGENPVSIDLEDMTIPRSYQAIADYGFSQEECAYVHQQGSIGFYRIWTTKEAIAKSQGKGLAEALCLDIGGQLLDTSLDEPIVIIVHDNRYEITQTLVEGTVMCTFARPI